MFAPKADASGRPNWTYDLVRYVRDGDVVFHWWKQAGTDPAIVGYSRAVGSVETSRITWQARGTVGRAAGAPITGPAWRFPLGEYVDLPDPVTLGRLRVLEPQLAAVRDSLEAAVGGPLYFPFAFSDKRPLRTTQGYLVKVPRSVVVAIPELQAALGGLAPDGSARPTGAPLPGDRRRQDPADRKAIERHAVDWALAYLVAEGYDVEDVGATEPYDILAMNDEEELHVEVKGSTGTATTVELTDGEVLQGWADIGSVFIVVDQIVLERLDGDERRTSGGRPRVWWPWTPEEERLKPIRYRYVVPPGGTAE